MVMMMITSWLLNVPAKSVGDGLLCLDSVENLQRHAVVVCCLLVAQRASNMLAYFRDGSHQRSVRAATLRYNLQIKLCISPSRSKLTPSQPVPALTLYRQAPGRVATGVPIFKSLV